MRWNGTVAQLIGLAAAVRFLLADEVRLLARGLEAA